MKRHIILGLFCLLLIFALAPVEAVTLRYAMKKGATVQYTVRIAAASRATGMGGAKSESRLEMTSTYRLKVTDVTSAGDMMVDLESISGTLKVTEGEKTNQSALPKAKPLHLKITPLGALSIVGPDDWQGETDKAEASFGVGSSTPTLDLLSAASIMPFPERDLKAGDSWESELTETLPMPPLPGAEGPRPTGTVKVKSQLVDLVVHKGRKCARIKTTYEMPFDAQSSPSPAVTIHVTGKMAGTGDWIYDYERSCTLSTQGTMQLLLKTSADLPVEMRERLPEGVSTDGALSMKANLKAVIGK